MRKYLGISLIISALLFIVAIIISSGFKPNYNLFFHNINELMIFDTNEIWLVEVLLYLANSFLLFGGVIAWLDYKKVMANKLRIIFGLLSIVGVLGIFLRGFPLKPHYLLALKPIGNIQLAFHAGTHISIYCMIIVVTALSWLLYRTSNINEYKLFSLLSFIVTFLMVINSTVALTLFMNGFNNNVGFFQIIVTSSFVIWLLIKGLLIYNNDIRNI